MNCAQQFIYFCYSCSISLKWTYACVWGIHSMMCFRVKNVFPIFIHKSGIVLPNIHIFYYNLISLGKLWHCALWHRTKSRIDLEQRSMECKPFIVAGYGLNTPIRSLNVYFKLGSWSDHQIKCFDFFIIWENANLLWKMYSILNCDIIIFSIQFSHFSDHFNILTLPKVMKWKSKYIFRDVFWWSLPWTLIIYLFIYDIMNNRPALTLPKHSFSGSGC